MHSRRPVVAGRFYPGDVERCRQTAQELLAGAGSTGAAAAAAGIVPHAGWSFSGPTAARVFAALRGQPVDTVVILAAHTGDHGPAEVTAHPAWSSPLGDVPIDEALCAALVAASDGALARADRLLDRDHSVEVQLPFLQEVLPDAQLVAAALPADGHAAERGRQIAAAIADLGRQALVLGSTDLTHYGSPYGFAPQGTGAEALRWVREENDARMVDLIRTLDAEAVVAEARDRRNACGAGAVAAALAAARAAGRTQATVLEYTTSQDVMPERRIDAFVGYVGAIA